MAIEPVTREERFLAVAGGRNVTPPAPITRKEQLLQGIIDAVKSGGATPDVIVGAVNDYLNANPVQPGATTEQAAQIEQNKTNIADLQEEIEDKQPKGDYVKTVNGNKPDATGNVVVATGGNGSGQNPPQDGEDGFSPTVAVSAITGGHRISITDKNGTKTVDVMDGEDGDPGNPGRGIKSIARTSGNGAAGTTDTYTITYTDDTTGTFTVRNGSNGTAGKAATLEITGVTALAPGAAPAITEASDSTAQARRYALAIPQGAPGYTPVKFVDYWTDADQEAIVQQVITALGTPVFGRVTEDKKINLSTEHLANGTYEVGFEDEKGNWVTIGYINHSDELPNLFNPDTALLNSRISSSGEIKACNGVCLTDYIPLTLDGGGREATMTGGEWWTNSVQNDNSRYVNLVYYDANKSLLGAPQFVESTNSMTYTKDSQFFRVNSNVYTTTIGVVGKTYAEQSLATFAESVRYVRIAIGVSTADAITKDDITNIKLTIAEAV